MMLGLCVPVSRAQAPQALRVEDVTRRITEESTRMDSIKTELERGRRKIAQLGKKEHSYLGTLNQIEKNIAAGESFLEEVTRRADSVSRRIDTLSASLDTARAELRRRQSAMKARLRSMYKSGRLGIREILSGRTDMTGILNRVGYFRQIIEYDRWLLGRIDSTREVVLARKTAEESERRKLESLRREKEREQSFLLEQQQSRRSLLEKVRGEKKAWRAMVAEYEEAQKELVSIISRLRERRDEAVRERERSLRIAFEKRKGTLPWPVEGRIVRPFGRIVHPVYKTVIANDGIDIAAPRGSAVTSVAPGRVLYVGWMRGYGKTVIVDHGAGYVTVFTHLDEILVARGADVEYGDRLGTVGETGSLSGTRLHFEIRGGDGAVDPAQWLEARTNGNE